MKKKHVDSLSCKSDSLQPSWNLQEIELLAKKCQLLQHQVEDLWTTCHDVGLKVEKMYNNTKNASIQSFEKVEPKIQLDLPSRDQDSESFVSFTSALSSQKVEDQSPVSRLTEEVEKSYLLKGSESSVALQKPENSQRSYNQGSLKPNREIPEKIEFKKRKSLINRILTFSKRKLLSPLMTPTKDLDTPDEKLYEAVTKEILAVNEGLEWKKFSADLSVESYAEKTTSVNDLACPRCFKPYNSENRKPLTLYCGDCMCETCVRVCLGITFWTVICGFCGKKSEIPFNGGIKEFPVHRNIMKRIL